MDSPDNVKERARALLNKEDFNEASLLFFNLTQTEPRNDWVWMCLGYAKAGLRKYKEAIAAYNKAIKLNPKRMESWKNRANAKYSDGDYKGAIQDLDVVLRDFEPDDDHAWVLETRGVSKHFLHTEKHNESALLDLDRAIELLPNRGFLWHMRGKVKCDLRYYEDAIPDLRQAIVLNSPAQSTLNDAITKAQGKDARRMKNKTPAATIKKAHAPISPSPSTAGPVTRAIRLAAAQPPVVPSAPPPGTVTLKNAQISFFQSTQSAPSAPVMGENTQQIVAQKSLFSGINYDELVFGEVIGKGGAGVVFSALLNQSPVAVKKSHSLEETDAMIKEYAVLGAIHHPNIITILGYSIGNTGEFCLVMELYPNGSLNQYLYFPENWDCPMSWRLESALRVAQGLSFLHEQGLLHLDLKPENVLVCSDWRVVISDFGISRKLVTNQTHQTTMSTMGTISYIAPEIIQPTNADGKTRYDKANDIYSLAILLWVCVAQKRPYEGWDPMRILAFVISKKREEIPKETPKKLAGLIKACWAPVPSSRPKAADVNYKLAEIYAKEKRDPGHTFPRRK